VAKCKTGFPWKFRTNLQADLEEKQFAAGEEVTLMQTWKRHYLVRDTSGHLHNIPKDRIEP